MLSQMAVYRVVAEIGLTALKPIGKRGLAVVANLAGLHMPVNQMGLLSPKSVSVI
jgi:hypothetical protein